MRCPLQRKSRPQEPPNSCGRLQLMRSYTRPFNPLFLASSLAACRRSFEYGAVRRTANRLRSISKVSPPCSSSSVCLHRLGYSAAYCALIREPTRCLQESTLTKCRQPLSGGCRHFVRVRVIYRLHRTYQGE